VKHLAEVEGQPSLPQRLAVVENADRVLDIPGVEHVAHATDGGSAEVAEVLQQVDAHSITEADVVFHEGGIAPLGEFPSGTVFVVGPTGVQVDPAVEGLLEGQALALVLDPPGAHRAEAHVGAVVLEAVVAQLNAQLTVLGVAVEAGAVDVEVGEGVAQPRSRLHRGSVEVVHRRQEVPTALEAELPALPGSGVLDVAVLHGLVGVVVLHADRELVLVATEAEAAPVPLVVAVPVGQRAGVRGEGVDLQAVGLGGLGVLRGKSHSESEDDEQDQVDGVLHDFSSRLILIGLECTGLYLRALSTLKRIYNCIIFWLFCQQC